MLVSDVKHTTKVKLVEVYEKALANSYSINTKLSTRVTELNIELAVSQKLARGWQTFGFISLGFNALFVVILLCL